MTAITAPTLSTPDHLLSELETLTMLERHYHAAHHEATTARFDQLVAPEFWEIGASGRDYSRAFARSVLDGRAGLPAPADWQDADHVLAQVAENLFLLTYTLKQPGRTTRRMSLWRQLGDAWQVIFHQGTPCL